MNTPKAESPLEQALAAVPTEFRKRIIKFYLDAKARHAQSAHDATKQDTVGVSAGKLCETIVRLLQHQLKGNYTPFGQQLTNVAAECESFSQLPKTVGNESLRVVIPRAVSFLYTLRNKRGIGHVGGDVEANAIDSVTVARVADWLVCELVRHFHSMSLEDADALVKSLASRDVPDIWEVGGKKRVLRADLDFKQKTLLLLYASTEPAVLAEDLFSWSKYSNYNMYKTRVLSQLDRANLVEYDRSSQSVILSPLGVRIVEDEILPRKVAAALPASGEVARH